MGDIVIIVGSPRKKGDTVTLASEAARGILDRNCTFHIFILNEMDYSGCQACYGCKRGESFHCVRNDDMQQIYAAIEQSCGMIIATSIYFGSVTGQTKLWLDRMFPYLSMEPGSNLPGKIPVSCIYTQNQPDSTLFTGSMDTFEYMLRIPGFEFKTRMIAPNFDFGRKSPVLGRKDLVKQAYDIGYHLCDV
ncbi:MAG: flavodoxin family protein [Methanomicrobiales archaeon]|nr:flavodoxin family protein [Methanomicrobiales archaeon]